MKNTFSAPFVLLLVFIMACGVNGAYAQTDRQSKSELRSNALKDARKEAKKYEKQGYTTMVGKLPMDKQIEAAWMAQTKKTEDGQPAFFVATAKAIGGNYNAAKIQADNLAKLDIASQVGASFAQIIDTKIANTDLGQGDVETLNRMISASKSVIAQTLGRTYTYVEISRATSKDAVEVMVTIGYDTKQAIAEAKRIIRKQLEEQASDLADFML